VSIQLTVTCDQGRYPPPARESHCIPRPSALIRQRRDQSLRRPSMGLRHPLLWTRPLHGADGVGVSQAPLACRPEALYCNKRSAAPDGARSRRPGRFAPGRSTAPSVMAGHFGLNLEQLASHDYTQTQPVSAQMHAMLAHDGLPRFHGVLYRSRKNYPAASIALFDCAEAKSLLSTPLIWGARWVAVFCGPIPHWH